MPAKAIDPGAKGRRRRHRRRSPPPACGVLLSHRHREVRGAAYFATFSRPDDNSWLLQEITRQRAAARRHARWRGRRRGHRPSSSRHSTSCSSSWMQAHTRSRSASDLRDCIEVRVRAERRVQAYKSSGGGPADGPARRDHGARVLADDPVQARRGAGGAVASSGPGMRPDRALRPRRDRALGSRRWHGISVHGLCGARAERRARRASRGFERCAAWCWRSPPPRRRPRLRPRPRS